MSMRSSRDEIEPMVLAVTSSADESRHRWADSGRKLSCNARRGRSKKLNNFRWARLVCATHARNRPCAFTPPLGSRRSRASETSMPRTVAAGPAGSRGRSMSAAASDTRITARAAAKDATTIVPTLRQARIAAATASTASTATTASTASAATATAAAAVSLRGIAIAGADTLQQSETAGQHGVQHIDPRPNSAVRRPYPLPLGGPARRRQDSSARQDRAADPSAQRRGAMASRAPRQAAAPQRPIAPDLRTALARLPPSTPRRKTGVRESDPSRFGLWSDLISSARSSRRVFPRLPSHRSPCCKVIARRAQQLKTSHKSSRHVDGEHRQRRPRLRRDDAFLDLVADAGFLGPDPRQQRAFAVLNENADEGDGRRRGRRIFGRQMNAASAADERGTQAQLHGCGRRSANGPIRRGTGLERGIVCARRQVHDDRGDPVHLRDGGESRRLLQIAPRYVRLDQEFFRLLTAFVAAAHAFRHRMATGMAEAGAHLTVMMHARGARHVRCRHRNSVAGVIGV